MRNVRLLATKQDKKEGMNYIGEQKDERHDFVFYFFIIIPFYKYPEFHSQIDISMLKFAPPKSTQKYFIKSFKRKHHPLT